MITILRVVNSNSKGMYQFVLELSGSIWGEATDHADDDILHPLPCTDMNIQMKDIVDRTNTSMSDLRFGFLDKRQFLRWVYDPDWRKAMDALGGRIQMIKIDPAWVAYGDEQVAFLLDNVTEIEEVPVTYFD